MIELGGDKSKELEGDTGANRGQGENGEPGENNVPGG